MGTSRTILRGRTHNASRESELPRDLWRRLSRRFRFLPPDVGTPGSLSWGCRRSPLRRTQSRSPLPVRPFRDLPSSRRLPTSTVFRPRGFSPPRRITPPRPCRDVAPDCRPWGSPRFRPLRGVVPATPFCPAELSSPDAAPQLDESSALGCGHTPSPCCHADLATPATLPPRRCASELDLRRIHTAPDLGAFRRARSRIVALRCRSATTDALLGLPPALTPTEAEALTRS